ncbi:ankyrin repeat domain-containing protein [bacterium]|nr:ankyrin repeat domain-containing protein [bacterium]
MKLQLIAIVAAVLVGCGKPQEVKDIQLRTAAKMGNIEGVKKAIADGANVNARDTSGNALNHATANRMPRAHLIGGHKGIVELLIAVGADVNVKNQRGRTPLYDAAIWDRKDIAKLLFDAGADVNAKDNDGKTPLDAAKEENKNEIEDLLRKKGGKTGKELEGGEPVAKKVPSQPSQPSPPPAESKPAEPVVEATQPEPPTAKAPDISIHEATGRGDIEAVKQHLAAGTDVNAKDDVVEWTTLLHAAVGGHKEIVELLIAKGADVNVKDAFGMTPLDRTIEWKRTETADLLRKHGGKTSEELKAK